MNPIFSSGCFHPDPAYYRLVFGRVFRKPDQDYTSTCKFFFLFFFIPIFLQISVITVISSSRWDWGLILHTGSILVTQAVKLVRSEEILILVCPVILSTSCNLLMTARDLVLIKITIQIFNSGHVELVKLNV